MIRLDNNTLKRWLGLSALTVVIMLGVSVWAATRPGLGSEICTHWDAAGICDGYGGTFTAFYLMPLIVAGVVLLIAAIPFIEPRRGNLALSRTAYLAIWSILLFYFLAFHVVVTINALHEAGVVAYNLEMRRIVPLLVGGLFIVMGNYLGKIRSNFLMGIRTPWTLSSDLAWDKTHRLGGKLFMLVGLIMIFSGMLPGAGWIWVMLGAMVVMLVVLTAYSYVVWKSDPNAGHSFGQDT